MDLEIAFLDFVVALLGCAEVKNAHEVGNAKHRLCKLGYPEKISSKDQFESIEVVTSKAMTVISN